MFERWLYGEGGCWFNCSFWVCGGWMVGSIYMGLHGWWECLRCSLVIFVMAIIIFCSFTYLTATVIVAYPGFQNGRGRGAAGSEGVRRGEGLFPRLPSPLGEVYEEGVCPFPRKFLYFFVENTIFWRILAHLFLKSYANGCGSHPPKALTPSSVRHCTVNLILSRQNVSVISPQLLGRSISSENQYIRLKYFSQVIYH